MPPKVHVIVYAPDETIEHDVTDLDDLLKYRNGPQVCWIDVQGLGDETTLQRIGEIFELDPLALEDAVNLTLQERHGDVFDPVRKRIRTGIGVISEMGPDYLAYALIDTVIDGYYPAIESIRQYLRDCHDHAVQIADVIETYLELASSLMDIYLSSMSQRTKEVMAVLTVVVMLLYFRRKEWIGHVDDDDDEEDDSDR